MKGFPVCVCPLLVGCMIVVSIFITYGIAAYLGHVDKLWPYISDTGDSYFERNVFSCLLSITSFFGFPTLYIRYQLLLKLTRKLDGWRCLKAIFFINFINGEIVVLCFFMVGNFQSNNPDYVHQISAAILIACGSVYCIIDTICTSRLHTHFGGKRKLMGFRSGISTGTLVFAILFFTGKQLSEKMRQDTWPAGVPLQLDFWNSTQPGYELHLMGTFSEWLFVMMLVFYFFTFAYEFNKYSLDLVFFNGRNRHRLEKEENGQSEKSSKY